MSPKIRTENAMNGFPSITRIIPGIKAGDEQAWTQFVNRFETGLLGRARQLLQNSQLRRRVDPEDLVNHAFARSWETRETLLAQTSAEVASFLLTILHNRFVDLCRPANPEESRPTWQSFTAVVAEHSPSDIPIIREQEILLHASLSQLPENQRIVVVMRHFDGLKFREIAERLGIETSAAAGLVRNGVHSLASMLRKSGKTNFLD